MATIKNRREPKSQSAAFRKAARELGADESPERFDTALKVVGKHTPKEKLPTLRPVRRGQPKAAD